MKLLRRVVGFIFAGLGLLGLFNGLFGVLHENNSPLILFSVLGLMIGIALQPWFFPLFRKMMSGALTVPGEEGNQSGRTPDDTCATPTGDVEPGAWHVSSDETETPLQSSDALPINMLTTESANQLFQFFLTHPQLTWDHINTGCEARADFMAELAVEKGLAPSKIWIEDNPGSDGIFGIYLNEAKTEYAFCNYHVAVVLNVNREDRTEEMIFDPAFFVAPVSRDTWVKRLSTHAGENGVQILVSESDWRNFFGPVQQIFARDKALKKRTELLALSKNCDDPTIMTGVFSLARGKWVDTLFRDDLQSFNELQDLCTNMSFAMWFKSGEKNTDLQRWLEDNPRYYGLQSSLLLETIDFPTPWRHWKFANWSGGMFAISSFCLLKSEMSC